MLYKELEQAYSEILFGWQENPVKSGGQRRASRPESVRLRQNGGCAPDPGKRCEGED